MAVSFISATSQTPSTGTTITFTGISRSSADLFLLKVGTRIAGQPSTTAIASVVLSAGLTSGAPVQVKRRIDANNTTCVEQWAVPNPAGSSGDLVVTIDASVDWQCVLERWAGTDLTTPCPLADADATSGVTNPLTLTPANLTGNDAASGMGANANVGDDPQHSATQTYTSNVSGVNVSAGYHLGTGAISCTWGSPVIEDVFVVVRIAAVAGGATPELPVRPLRQRTAARHAQKRRRPS